MVFINYYLLSLRRVMLMSYEIIQLQNIEEMCLDPLYSSQCHFCFVPMWLYSQWFNKNKKRMILEKSKSKTELQNKLENPNYITWIRKCVGLPIIAYNSNLFWTNLWSRTQLYTKIHIFITLYCNQYKYQCLLIGELRNMWIKTFDIF